MGPVEELCRNYLKDLINIGAKETFILWINIVKISLHVNICRDSLFKNSRLTPVDRSEEEPMTTQKHSQEQTRNTEFPASGNAGKRRIKKHDDLIDFHCPAIFRFILNIFMIIPRRFRANLISSALTFMIFRIN